MALILKRLYQQYVYTLTELPDPKTQGWFLSSSPVQPLFIMVMYLVINLDVLPRYMENRKPFNLKKILIVYNVFQVLTCGYIALSATNSVFKLNPFCSVVDRTSNPESMKLANLVWMYYMVKITDLLDTVFIVLRKKSNQVSFLHIYHHFGMVFIAWVGVKYLPGGHSIFIGYTNCIVHAFMYSYYLFASMYKENSLVQKCKKHITQLQLAQFVFNFVIYCIPILDMSCGFPKFALLFFVPQNMLMSVLFADFYYKEYWVKSSKQNQAK